MALQVWLPLTKNLENQGLSDVRVSLKNGAASFVGGKIGNAFYNSSAGNSILIPWTHANTEELSILLWVKPQTPGAWSDIFTIGKYYNRLENNGYNYYYFFHDNVGLYGNSVDSGEIEIGTLPNETWTHIAFTVSGTELKIYKNGELFDSRSQKYQLSEVMDAKDVIRIGGRRDNEPDFYYQAVYNDVRIYDNCLSAKEIKEISKGLCCHYTLNSIPNENLISGCYSCTSTKDSFSSTGSIVSHVTADMLNNNRGKTLCLSYRVKNDGEYSYDSGIIDWARNRFGIHGSTHYVDSSGTTHVLYPLADLLYVGKKDGRYFTTWTIPTSSEYTFTTNLGFANQTWYHGFAHPASSNDETWYLDQIKLEWGTKPTPWSPHSIDEAYKTLGFDTFTEPDVSGFGNNGYFHDESSGVEFAPNSPRYDGCYKFLSKHYLIGNSPWRKETYLSEFTLSFWLNQEDGSGDYSTFFNSWGYGSDGLWLGMNVEGKGAWAFRNVSPCYATTTPFVCTHNEWYHFVYVFINGNVGWYVNGNAQTWTKYNDTTMHILDYFILGDNYSGTTWNTTFIGKISDFRWYATALTAEDIKELYNTPITITNNGTLLTQGEFKEEE